MRHEKDGGCSGTKGGGCGESETWGREGEEIRDRKDEYYDEAMVHEGGERRRKEVMDAVRVGVTQRRRCHVQRGTALVLCTTRSARQRRGEKKRVRGHRERERQRIDDIPSRWGMASFSYYNGFVSHLWPHSHPHRHDRGCFRLRSWANRPRPGPPTKALSTGGSHEPRQLLTKTHLQGDQHSMALASHVAGRTRTQGRPNPHWAGTRQVPANRLPGLQTSFP